MIANTNIGKKEHKTPEHYSINRASLVAGYL